MNRKYTDKYVAFIDILGFRALLEREGNDASRISGLFDALIKCKDLSPRINRFTNKRNPLRTIEEVYSSDKSVNLFQCYDAALKDMIIKIVSDSIILATPVSDDFAFTVIVDACSFIAQYLLTYEEGYLVRGAITRGNVYFEEENVFFGEAYVRAYMMEKDSCLYPRIIYENSYDQYPYANSFGRTLTRCGDDGWGDIDYIGNYLGIHDDCWLEERERRLLSIVDREIQKNEKAPEICAKYRWVKSQIDRSREYVNARQNI